MQQENRYVIDPESAAEMARLSIQARMATHVEGGLPLSLVRRPGHVLDLACGPGGWALDLAQALPDVEVTGMDISQLMMDYAQTQATEAMGLRNAHFQVGDILQPLPFADASFDLVNLRFAVGFMKRTAWSELLAQCMRLLKSGGILRLTETEAAVTNAPAYEQASLLLSHAVYRRGYGFAESQFGITVMLRKFLRDAGFVEIIEHPSAINFSYGTQHHDTQCQNFAIGFQLLRPLILRMEMATSEQFDRIYEESCKEMQRESFCAVSYVNTAWGTKP